MISLHPSDRPIRAVAQKIVVIVAIGLIVSHVGSARPAAAQSALPDAPTGGDTDADDSKSSLSQRANRTARNLTKWMVGKEADDLSRAKQLYRDANAAFENASALSGDERKSGFVKSAKLFTKSAEAAEGKALEQDALFMSGEAFFFADRLNAATEAFQRLQTDHPRNRHSDRAAARLFSISQYWIDVAKVEDNKWFALNWSDRSRPRVDPDGHAIRVLDQLRYDDPTGRLADDATMAAAAEYIRQKKFEEADEFLTDLRETFPDSDHLFLAHMFGIQCKLQIYRGPKYSGLVLDEAAKVIEQTRRKFPDKLQDEKYAEMLARASATVAFQRADRYIYRADYREKKREYGAARYWYRRLLEDYPEIPQADTARTRLEAIAQRPAEPEQQLSWLLKVFPDERRANPLQLKTGGGTDNAAGNASDPNVPSTGKVLRR